MGFGERVISSIWFSQSIWTKRGTRQDEEEEEEEEQEQENKPNMFVRNLRSGHVIIHNTKHKKPYKNHSENW